MKSLSAWLGLASLLGLLNVAFGAFGAHGASDPDAARWLRTGAEYGLIHCLACFAAGVAIDLGHGRARLAPAFFIGGVLLFSGSLYAMALGAPRWLGAITPIGGLGFMIGWGLLAFALFSSRRSA